MKQVLRNQAQALLQANDLVGARTIFQQICNENTADVESWYMLGVLSARTGALDMAKNAFEQAVQLSPGTAELHDCLGGVLQEKDMPEKAIKYHREAIKLKPDYPYAHYNLGNAYRKAGKLDKAASCYRKSIQLEKNYPDAYKNLGNTLRMQGKLKEAETSFSRLVSLDPANAEAHACLGQVLQLQGKNAEAMNSLAESLKLDPVNVMANLHMGAILRERGCQDEAIEHLEKVIQLRPNMIEAYALMANVMNNAGRYDQAMAHIEKMLELEPGSPDAIASMSAVLEKLGRYDEALEKLQPMLDSAAGNTNVEAVFARLSHKFHKREEAIKRLNKTLARSDLTIAKRQSLHYELGRLHDREGHFNEAFSHYRKANTVRPGHYDKTEDNLRFNALRAIYSAEFMKRMPRASNRSGKPVFIVGMPRSGTSLVEQILASHPEVYGAGELDFIIRTTEILPARLGSMQPYPDCVVSIDQHHLDGIAVKYLENINLVSGNAARVTDKLPHNFLHLGLIELLFPEARVIHCVRDPIDTCLSCYFTDFGDKHPYSRNLSDLGAYYQQYQELMHHWHEVLNIPIMDISYEALVENQAELSKNLIEYCDLQWDEQCIDFYQTDRIVTTASYDQVRQPIYKTSVQRWKNYEKFIGPLMEELSVLKPN